MKKASLYKKLSSNMVKCTACSWYCTIAPGKLGKCCTRLNKNGKLYSLVYGRPTGLGLDPVEKKPLYHLLPGSDILSFGTVGCNFGCLFCQNSWASQENIIAYKEKGELSSVENIIDKYSISITPKEIVDVAMQKKASGIAYTYNEPAIFAELAYDTAKLAHKKGLKNIFVSNGFESDETFQLMCDVLDAINIDLKSISNDFYMKICKARVDPVLTNIKKFYQKGILTEVTTLIIPNHNDSDRELTKIAKFIKSVSSDIPWHISAFHPSYQMLDTPPTPMSTLIRAYNIGKKQNLKYIYIGNVRDDIHSQTHCPKCHSIIVRRIGYTTKIENLNQKKGTCSKCNTLIYGVWN